MAFANWLLVSGSVSSLGFLDGCLEFSMTSERLFAEMYLVMCHVLLLEDGYELVPYLSNHITCRM